MQLRVVTIQPVQQIAAEPATLQALVTALHAPATELSAEPPFSGQLGTLTGLPRIPDPRLPRGTVYLRPAPARSTIISAPWTPEQVDTLNRFQRASGTHPFTCGANHTRDTPTLIATPAGWTCPDDDCTYTQDWAHAFMADPDLWPATPYNRPAASTQE